MAQWTFSVPIPRFLAQRSRAKTFWGNHPHRDVIAMRAASNRRATAMISEGEMLPATENDGKSLEQQIMDGLDRSALVFLTVLESDERDPITKLLTVDVKTRMDAFKMLADWTVKRKKSAPQGDPNALPPYEQIRKSLDDMGFKIVPKSKTGRPTKDELEKRALVMGEVVKSDDDTTAPLAGDEGMAARLRRLADERGAKGPANGV